MSAFLARHRRALLLAPWIILVGVMLGGRYYTYYVAAWHGYLQAAGLGLMLLVFLASWADRRATAPAPSCACRHSDEPERPPSLLNLAVQWVPLLIFLAVGPTSLNLDASGLAAAGVRNGQRAAPPAQNGPAGQAALAGEEPPRWVEGYLAMTLLDLHRAYVKDGRLPEKVLLVGRAYQVGDQERANLPEDVRANGVKSFIYRFVISCCTADARPVSVVLRGGAAQQVQSGDWYEVRGHPLVLPGPSRSLALEVESFHKVEAPRSPYLSAVF